MKSPFVLSLFLFPMGCTSAQQVTVEEIHSALSAYYGSIQSLRCEFIRPLSDGTDMRCEWLQQADMFRFTSFDYSSDRVSQVIAFNGKQGKRLTFQKDGPAQCEIRSDFEQDSCDWRLPIDLVGLRLRCVPGTSLADITKVGSCSIVGYEKIAGARCVHLRYQPVIFNPVDPSQLVVDAFLDIEHGFLPRRLEFCFGGEYELVHTWDIHQYDKVKDLLTGDDRWFPVLASVQSESRKVKIPHTGGGARMLIREVQINKLEPPETFDPQIPSGTRVIDAELNRKYVQGGEVAVAEQVSALARGSLGNSRAETQGQTSSPIQAYPPRSGSWALYITAIASLCCLGLAIWRRARSV